MNTNQFVWAAALVLMGLADHARAQHVHLTAGATSTSPGSKLILANASAFNAESRYVFASVLRTTGPAAGLYDANTVTFTALARDPLHGGPEDGHAGDGAQIALEVVSLAGPPGGTWSFWESLACEDFGSQVTFSIAVGETNGTNRFLLSQNVGLPDDDPYGHCHGRRFTLNKPGLYTLGVRLVDESHNGPGGGPVHMPSGITRLYFQADVTLEKLVLVSDVITVTLATRTGSRYFLEMKTNLMDTVPWQSAGVALGDNHLQMVPDQSGTRTPQRYYRVRVTTP